MAVADRTMLMKRIETGLGNTLTVNQLNVVMQTIMLSFGDYEVTYHTKNNVENGSYELLDAFLTAKRVEGRSAKTIDRYRYIINRMMKSIGVPLPNMNVYHIRQHLTDLSAVGNSDRTIEGYRAIYSSFFGWLHREGLLPQNPIANIGVIKCQKKIRLPFSKTDIEKLKEHCRTLRDKAIIQFLLCTGCRISEVCTLNRDAINFQTHEVTVLGKGNKQRTVYMDDICIMLLERYFTERTDNSPALFVGKGSDRMTPGGIRNMLKSIEEDSGVDNVHPHRFRRTLATNLINRGMPIQGVAAILGHDKIDTTMKYIYVAQSNVKSTYNKCVG